MTWFVHGGMIDIVLAFILVEFGYLAWRKQFRGRAMIDLLFALAPGVCLLIAARFALADAPWYWVAGAVATSLPFHLTDLARRRL